MHEIRYRGGLLSEHDSEAAASAHVDKHHADIQDKDALQIAPARPVRLYCRGALAETFLSAADAEAYIDAHATENAPQEVWWYGSELPQDVHNVWPVKGHELDTSDEATVWAEGTRPLPLNETGG